LAAPAPVVLPSTGSLVVSIVQTLGVTNERPAQPGSPPPSLAWRMGSRSLAVTPQSIAPGVYSYAVPAAPLGDWLVTGLGPPFRVRTIAMRQAALAPPVPASIDVVRVSHGYGRDPGPMFFATVRLTAPVPAGIVGVVGYFSPTTVPSGLADAFAAVVAGAMDVPLYRPPSRCGHGLGRSPPRDGMRVTLAFLDFSGRVSARSTQLIVHMRDSPAPP